MASNVINIKVCSSLKLSSGLTGNYHAICRYSYNLLLAISVTRPKKIKMLNRLIILILFLGGLKANCQVLSDSIKVKSIKNFSLYYQLGSVLKTNDFVRGKNMNNEEIDDFMALSLRYSIQTRGHKLWEKLYNCPEHGFGFYYGHFFESEEVGDPLAIYYFMKNPVWYSNKFLLNIETGFGMAFNWEKFEIPQNPYNIALSLRQSVFIDLGLMLEYRLSQHWNIEVGGSFSHFSNGATKKPNFGINTFAPKVSIKYKLNEHYPLTRKFDIPKHTLKNEFDILYYTGWKNVLYEGSDVDSITKYQGVYYNIHGVSFIYSLKANHKSSFGVGTTLGYYGGANQTISVYQGALTENEASLKSGLEWSVFPCYELDINNISLLIQLGFYVYRKDYSGKPPNTYQRIGLKYYLYKSVYAGISLRAYNYHVSDYIEWNLGFTLK
jgi:hypothetical protein